MSIIAKNEITKPLINQLIKCGTSVGANYCEATMLKANKILNISGICKKNRVNQAFLRMIAIADPNFVEQPENIWQEANELNFNFQRNIQKSLIFRN